MFAMFKNARLTNFVDHYCVIVCSAWECSVQCTMYGHSGSGNLQMSVYYVM